MYEMSFSSQVKEELNSIQIKGNCCKRAYLYGVLMLSSLSGDIINMTLSDPSTAEKVLLFLKTLYKIEPIRKDVNRGCFKATTLTFESKKLRDYILYTDSFSSESAGTHYDSLFSCANCRTAFLRGLFCACGSVSDPQKTYTLEIRVANNNRADLVSSVIKNRGIPNPCKTARKNAIGLFYRNESSVEDILTACGVSKSLFTFFDASVKKDLRNTENRATNCVAKNILKSVETAAAQINAIEALMSAGIFDELSSELKSTARLRRENPDISLSELALMHNPPISKSGLNHRLSKITEEAKKINLK